jgi:hypothetical protein
VAANQKRKLMDRNAHPLSGPGIEDDQMNAHLPPENFGRPRPAMLMSTGSNTSRE